MWSQVQQRGALLNFFIFPCDNATCSTDNSFNNLSCYAGAMYSPSIATDLLLWHVNDILRRLLQHQSGTCGHQLNMSYLTLGPRWSHQPNVSYPTLAPRWSHQPNVSYPILAPRWSHQPNVSYTTLATRWSHQPNVSYPTLAPRWSHQPNMSYPTLAPRWSHQLNVSNTTLAPRWSHQLNMSYPTLALRWSHSLMSYEDYNRPCRLLLRDWTTWMNDQSLRDNKSTHQQSSHCLLRSTHSYQSFMAPQTDPITTPPPRVRSWRPWRPLSIQPERDYARQDVVLSASDHNRPLHQGYLQWRRCHP